MSRIGQVYQTVDHCLVVISDKDTIKLAPSNWDGCNHDVISFTQSEFLKSVVNRCIKHCGTSTQHSADVQKEIDREVIEWFRSVSRSH